jgi:hypothetical protein
LRKQKILFDNVCSNCKFSFVKGATNLTNQLFLKNGFDGIHGISMHGKMKAEIIKNEKLRNSWKNVGD